MTPNEHDFPLGTNVMLASGGPGMTVIDVGRYTGFVWCRWMRDGEPRESAFPAAALTADPRLYPQG